MSSMRGADFSKLLDKIKRTFFFIWKPVPDFYNGEVHFNKIEGMEKPFSPYYNEYIRPFFEKYEHYRIATLQEMQRRARIVTFIYIIPCSILILYYSFQILLDFLFYDSISYNEDNLFFIIFGPFFGLIIAGFFIHWVIAPSSNYERKVKNEVFPKIIKFFGDDFKYSEKSPLSPSNFTATGVPPFFACEYVEDYIRGKYKGVKLELTEVCLSSSSNDGHVVFAGVLILLSMNKSFSGHTIVTRDSKKKAPKVNWNTIPEGKEKLQRVRLENSKFEEIYQVYSTDQVEARYLLTPIFMERLVELQEMVSKEKMAFYHNDTIRCGFFNNKLLMMIPTYDNKFETSSIFKPATFEDEINTILKEMEGISRLQY